MYLENSDSCLASLLARDAIAGREEIVFVFFLRHRTDTRWAPGGKVAGLRHENKKATVL